MNASTFFDLYKSEISRFQSVAVAFVGVRVVLMVFLTYNFSNISSSDLLFLALQPFSS